jgi:hypothetical protein
MRRYLGQEIVRASLLAVTDPTTPQPNEEAKQLLPASA